MIWALLYTNLYSHNVRPERSSEMVFFPSSGSLPFGFSKTTLMLKELRSVHKNTPFNQNIRFKVNVIMISSMYTWVLDIYDKLICQPFMQDFAVIILFGQKVRFMVFFCTDFLNYALYTMFYYIKLIKQFGCFKENLLTREKTQWTIQTYIM
jgi:hypothetical protein